MSGYQTDDSFNSDFEDLFDDTFDIGDESETLHEVCHSEYCCPEKVRALIQAGHRINEINEDGETPLMAFLLNMGRFKQIYDFLIEQQIQTFGYLVSIGAKANHWIDGFLADGYEKFDLTNLILIAIDSIDCSRSSCLHTALTFKDETLLEVLLKNIDPNEVWKVSGEQTALHIACQHFSVKVVQHLLKIAQDSSTDGSAGAGASNAASRKLQHYLDAQDNSGATALHYAVMRCTDKAKFKRRYHDTFNLSHCDALLAAGANTLLMDTDGNTPVGRLLKRVSAQAIITEGERAEARSYNQKVFTSANYNISNNQDTLKRLISQAVIDKLSTADTDDESRRISLMQHLTLAIRIDDAAAMKSLFLALVKLNPDEDYGSKAMNIAVGFSSFACYLALLRLEVPDWDKLAEVKPTIFQDLATRPYVKALEFHIRTGSNLALKLLNQTTLVELPYNLTSETGEPTTRTWTQTKLVEEHILGGKWHHHPVKEKAEQQILVHSSSLVWQCYTNRLNGLQIMASAWAHSPAAAAVEPRTAALIHMLGLRRVSRTEPDLGLVEPLGQAVVAFL